LMTFLIIVICPSFPISRGRSLLVFADVIEIELEVRTMISKVIKDRDNSMLFLLLMLKLSIYFEIKLFARSGDRIKYERVFNNCTPTSRSLTSYDL